MPPEAVRIKETTMSFRTMASALALLACMPAHAAPTELSLVFGDSLSDTGNAFALTGGTYPDPAYYRDGRFSNGDVWVDRLGGVQAKWSDFLLDQPVSANAGVINFAVGGARSGDEPLDLATLSVPGVLTQVQAYRDLVAAARITAPARVTAYLWGGGNDFGNHLAAAPQAADAAEVARVVGNTRKAAEDLRKAGVTRLVVMNSFDYSDLPMAAYLDAATIARGDRMLADHAAALGAEQRALETALGIRVDYVDVQALLSDITARPQGYGVLDPKLSCLGPDGVCADPDKRVFWDDVHLSATGQRIVSEFVKATGFALDTAAGVSAVVADSSMAVASAQRRLIDRHLSGASRVAGGISVSLLGDYSAGRRGETSALADYNLAVQDVGLGLDWSNGAGLRLGAILGYLDLDGDLAQALGSVKGDSVTASVFAQYDAGPLRMTVNGGYGQVDFGHMERTTGFFASPLATAKTDAVVWSLGGELSYRVRVADGMTLSPLARLDWANARVDGWTETGAGPLGLTVADQTHKRLLGAAGLDLRAGEGGRVQPLARVLYERRLSESGTLDATLGRFETVSQSIRFEDRSKWVGDLGLIVDLGAGIAGQVGYHHVIRRGGDDEQGISAGLRLSF